MTALVVLKGLAGGLAWGLAYVSVSNLNYDFGSDFGFDFEAACAPYDPATLSACPV